MYIFHRRKYITKYNIKIIEKYLTYNYFFISILSEMLSPVNINLAIIYQVICDNVFM